MKVALVTGASRGIGRATALRLAQEGYAVAINYKQSKQAAAETLQAAREAGADALLVRADVTQEQAVGQMVTQVCDAFGHIDLLVNNAGVSAQGLLTDMTAEQWHSMMAAHLDAAFYTCRAVLPGMIARKNGCIVNMSSMWGQVGASCEAAYSAAKAGVIGLTKALAKELAPSGIRVNAVAPGAIDTDMMAGFTASERAAIVEEIPLGRLGMPEEAAATVAFLASPQAAYITGQILCPNGGMVM